MIPIGAVKHIQDTAQKHFEETGSMEGVKEAIQQATDLKNIEARETAEEGLFDPTKVDKTWTYIGIGVVVVLIISIVVIIIKKRKG